MARVLVPDAAPGFSALGLLTADHVVDNGRALVQPWQAVDTERLTALADDLERAARAELAAAGLAEERLRFEWLLNLVYPGQTFDNALPLARRAGEPITGDDVRACVDEFHRRNEAARLIEARAQEPTVRGIRLVATGLVDQPTLASRPTGAAPAVTSRRRVHVGGAWHDDVAVYDGDTLAAGATIEGPAVLARRFTTVLLRPGDRANAQPNGDVLIEVAH
jgi:N-methylhydantoinase A/oxoprolinase/acetone carboxylase beta subunit